LFGLTFVSERWVEEWWFFLSQEKKLQVVARWRSRQCISALMKNCSRQFLIIIFKDGLKTG
jgi:hypothetical protein|tara:strand:- start:99 stop:281 length:183 start_codon:yes stop_codon:yes gene_type:complete